MRKEEERRLRKKRRGNVEIINTNYLEEVKVETLGILTRCKILIDQEKDMSAVKSI